MAIFTEEDMKARSTEELYSSHADEEDTTVKNYASDEDDDKIIELDTIISFQMEVKTLFTIIFNNVYQIYSRLLFWKFVVLSQFPMTH